MATFAPLFLFRRYFTLRHQLTGLHLTAQAIREARQRRQQARHETRMRRFYSWCEACRGLSFLF